MATDVERERANMREAAAQVVLDQARELRTLAERNQASLHDRRARQLDRRAGELEFLAAKIRDLP
jgi:hypothetical protein